MTGCPAATGPALPEPKLWDVRFGCGAYGYCQVHRQVYSGVWLLLYSLSDLCLEYDSKSGPTNMRVSLSQGT